jgi:uncharacterized membrane protein
LGKVRLVPKRKNAAKNDLGRSELMLVRLALFVAIGISAFLAWNSLKGGAVPGCGPESDCDKVLSSRWGTIFGLPVSLFALPVYGALLYALYWKALNWRIVLPLALIVLLAAVWFVGIQAFALRAFCKFCMTAHAAGLLAALFLLRGNPLSTRLTVGSLGLAAVLVSAFGVAQYIGPAPGPIQVVSQPAPAAPASNQISMVAVAATPTFAVVDGQFPLDLSRVPITGPVQAPKKLAKLFDYTCHHCRDLHHLLKEFHRKHFNELAVISLPVPLDSGCNPALKRTMPAHANACEYARMGLAVFFANPAKFDEFTAWVFAPARPPELPGTRAFAESLVGKEAFAAALNDPRVEAQIKADVDIYLASSRRAGKGAMPQMLFGQGGSIGAVRDSAQLEKILYANLGLGNGVPATSVQTP